MKYCLYSHLLVSLLAIVCGCTLATSSFAAERGNSAPKEEHEAVPLKPAEIFHIGKFAITNSMLVTWMVAAGIIVEEYLLTADPDISAIGDCALYASPRFGGSLRLESVQNATDHARCVAARLTSDAKSYDGLPWFWSDQGPNKLQIAGLTTGYDQVVVRGDRAQGAFSAFCYKSRQLAGIESVNRAGDHMFGRRLLAANGSITPEQAADSSFDLKSALT